MSRMPLAHVSDATSSACVDLEAVAPEMEGFGTVTVHSIPGVVPLQPSNTLLHSLFQVMNL